MKDPNMLEDTLTSVIREAVSLKRHHAALIAGSATAVRTGQCCELNRRLRNILRDLPPADRIVYVHQVNRARLLDPDLDGLIDSLHDKPCPCGRDRAEA